MLLQNRVNKKELKKRIQEETTKRITVSFYRYVIIDQPSELRDHLFIQWNQLKVLGRIYVAHEGINAQLCVPEDNWELFKAKLDEEPFFKGMPFKIAVEDVDMRNQYESEVGKFAGAICPDADTFREELPIVIEQLKDQKDKKIIMYCTGGVRCEKASAYLKHHGFKDVNQLHGGIIDYVRQIKAEGLSSKFIGKNFVFDERVGERITDDVIAHCHQCGESCDTHVNCANDDCHLLFIQCEKCVEKMNGCCTPECMHIASLPIVEQRLLRKGKKKEDCLSVYKSRLRPNLKELLANKGLIYEPQQEA